MGERILRLVAGLLLSLVVGLALFWQPELPQRPLPQAAVRAGGDFTLQSATGDVSLQAFRGKLVLIYFGYTYCPDICPTALAGIAEGLKQLTPAELARLTVIFISVDPERDTPARLKEYVDFFHPNMVGLTGTPENLAGIASRYGVFYARQKVETGGGYVVDHSSETYIVGPEGHLLGKIAHATPPDQIAREIRQRLPQTP